MNALIVPVYPVKRETQVSGLDNAVGHDRNLYVPVDDLLDLTRDVAHNVERKFAPLTTYMLGVAAGQSGKSVDELIAAVQIALNEFGVSE